jgi:hypothetical protein
MRRGDEARVTISEASLTSTYTCPHCRSSLQAESDGWDGWRRCPVCQRVALPPEPSVFDDPSQQLPVPSNDKAALITPVAAVGPIPFDVDEERLALAAYSSPTSPARLIFTTGMVVSLILALLAFLDLRPMTTGIFGFLAIVFFLLLLRTPRPKRR